ncbi:MAG: MotA/TolQ/ExbB proton channel family protein [Chthoniobacteraceae bacterium]|nr:MotA/TolQ/ExbB proton channel family protein [Chthoniobacteraceae bacterium]
MDALRHCLYLFSNGLLLPTLVLVLLVAAWTLVMTGGILREGLTRREVRRALGQALATLKKGTEGRHAALAHVLACKNGLPALFGKILGRRPKDLLEREKCLEDLESAIARSLSRLTWTTRIGPMLGLMGTLIPLGPALNGLASGNVAALSSNLVVAFTTTVIGVFIGCAAFTMHLIRRNWYERDLSDLEYILQRITEQPASYATQEEKVG